MNFEPSVEEEPTSNRNPNLALSLHTPPTCTRDDGEKRPVCQHQCRSNSEALSVTINKTTTSKRQQNPKAKISCRSPPNIS